jgi:hypothetical protein
MTNINNNHPHPLEGWIPEGDPDSGFALTDSSFSGVATDKGGATPTPNDVQPKWEEITSGTGTYLVRATVIVGGVSLTGTQTPADIVINDIEKVEWEQIDGINIKLGGNPNGSGKRCFPEKDSPNGAVNNLIYVETTLSQALLPSMTARVDFKLFDPDHPLGVAKMIP